MRNLADLPHVRCELNFEDAGEDIVAFRFAARACYWTEEEVETVISDTLSLCESRDEIGEMLHAYCIPYHVPADFHR
jgi:hypothetical protein